MVTLAYFYDIGCATGTTMALIDRAIGDIRATLVGIDNSKQMLKQTREKLNHLGTNHPYELKCVDIHKPMPVENASVRRWKSSKSARRWKTC